MHGRVRKGAYNPSLPIGRTNGQRLLKKSKPPGWGMGYHLQNTSKQSRILSTDILFAARPGGFFELGSPSLHLVRGIFSVLSIILTCHVRATLLFGSQRAVSICLRYPIPVGHCQQVVPWFTEDKSKALLTYTLLKVRLWRWAPQAQVLSGLTEGSPKRRGWS